MGEEALDLELPEETTPAPLPTEAELKEGGFSKDEIEKAKKLGKVAEEKKEPEPKKEEPEKKKPEEEPKKAAEKKEEAEPEDEPEKDEKEIEKFNANEKALYHKAKEQKRLKQLANEERDIAERKVIDLKAKLEENERRWAEYNKETKIERDEEGNVIDPDDKPLTRKEWLKIQEEEQGKRSESEKLMAERRQAITISWARQEENAKLEYDDFDQTVGLAKEVMEKANSMFEGKRLKQVQMKIREFIESAAQADKFGLSDYNPADMAYDLGKLHPDYGKPKKKAENTSDKTDRNGNGGLTPEEMERIEKNANRRGSSASLPGGGGRRIVSAEDITLEDLSRCTPAKYRELRRKYPDKVKELLNS